MIMVITGKYQLVKMRPINVVLLCFIPLFALAQKDLKICAKQTLFDECLQIDRDDNIECKIFFHDLDCLMSISNDTATFGTITADEAAIAYNFLDNIRVVAEIRSAEEKTNPEEFKIVVLVKDGTIKSFDDLRNRKLCHPGYGKLNVPHYVVDMFEQAVLERVYGKGCKSKDTLVEYQISKLSEFFGSSCKPGPWVYEREKDKELKKMYADKLCGSCDGLANDNCDIPSNTDPFKTAMKCFKSGDIVITTAQEVRKITPSINYYYLCRDGTVSKTECYWSRKPWNVIVTNRKKSDSVIAYLKQTFYDQMVNGAANILEGRKVNIKPYLQNVLKSDSDMVLEFIDQDLKDYIREFNYVPEGDPSCDAKLKWCVTSDIEMEKCTWFKEAVRNQGILPGIGCLQKENRVQCLNKINKKEVDIVTIDNNLGYTARKYNLKAVAFPETDDEVKSMLVVKNLQNNIQLSNLKGKKGCFAEFADIAYISFFENLNNSKLVKPTCDYGAFANEFLGESCVPGVNDPDRKPTKVTDIEKLCKLCSSATGKSSTVCSANYDNQYFGNEGALKCLNDDVGDFAVISNRNVSEELLKSNDFIVICKNGTLAHYAGLIVDDNCYLSITSSSELVVKTDYKYYNDSMLALSAFEVVFGQDLYKPFDLFGPFNGKLDLMFKDSTPGLNFNPEDNRYTKNYVELFEDFDNCLREGKSSAVKIDSKVFPVILTTIFAYVGINSLSKL